MFRFKNSTYTNTHTYTYIKKNHPTTRNTFSKAFSRCGNDYHIVEPGKSGEG